MVTLHSIDIDVILKSTKTRNEMNYLTVIIMILVVASGNKFKFLFLGRICYVI